MRCARKVSAASCMPRIESIVASSCVHNARLRSDSSNDRASSAKPRRAAVAHAAGRVDRQILAARGARFGDALPPEPAPLARATRRARKRVRQRVAHVLQRPTRHEHDDSEDRTIASGAPLAACRARRHFDARSRCIDALRARRRRSAVAIHRRHQGRGRRRDAREHQQAGRGDRGRGDRRAFAFGRMRGAPRCAARARGSQPARAR